MHATHTRTLFLSFRSLPFGREDIVRYLNNCRYPLQAAVKGSEYRESDAAHRAGTDSFDLSGLMFERSDG